MPESRRSLASYFDESPDDHVATSHDWYEQTREHRGGSLAASSDDHDHGIAGVYSHDIPDLSEDEWEGEEHDHALGAESLGMWLWHPGHEKPVWVPPDDIYSTFQLPPGHVFQEKGQTQWAANAWGKDEYERRYKIARGLIPNEKETKEQRAVRRQKMNDLKTKAYEMAYAVATKQNSAILPSDVITILKNLEARRKATVDRKNEKLDEIKGEAEASKANGTSMTSKARNAKLHELKVNTLKTVTGFSIKDILEKLDNACKAYGFQNTVGTDPPPENTDGTHYVFVALDFLGKVKKMIMNLALAAARKKIKAGEFSPTAEKRDLYDFVNYCYQGNDLRNRLANKKKGRYPRPVPKGLADTEAMTKWTTHVREVERAAYRVLHPGKKLPKRLQDPRKGRGKKGKGKKGKGKGGGDASDLLNKIAEAVVEKMESKNNKGKHGKGKQHHHKQPVHTFDGPAGDPSPYEQEEEHVVSPPPERGARPTYRPKRWFPAGPPGSYRPEVPPVGNGKRMQRGYF